MKHKSFLSQSLLIFASVLMLRSETAFGQACLCPTGLCTGNVLVEDYNVPASWTYDNAGGSLGTMTVNGSLMNYNGVTGAGCNRLWRALPSIDGATMGLRAECKVNIISGNAPGHYVMAFSKASYDPISICTPTWTPVNNEVIWVALLAPNMPGNVNCCTAPNNPNNPWRFYIQSKIGTTLGHQPT